MARALPVFKMERFWAVMPTASARSLEAILRRANITSRLMTIDMATVVVSEIDTDKRKITLAPVGESREHDDWKHFAKKEKAAVPQGGGLTLLGDKLQEAFAKKNH